MERNELFDRLNEIFRDVFDEDDIILRESTTSDEIEDWDSMVHVHLIVEIERAFGIKFTMNEVNQMKNVGSMVTIIQSKLANK